MDLGLTGKTAIVCASSRGLGKACAIALAQEGCEVIINGRDITALNRASAEILDKSGRSPVILKADINTPEGRAKLVSAAPDADILVNNNGGPAPGALGEWEHADWLAALESNMLSAIHMTESLIGGMRARKFGRIINITSAMVKTPRLPMALSTTARAGLTAFAKALSVEVARDNVTVNNILPEKIETDRLAYMTAENARRLNVPLQESRARILKTVPARRFGRPEEFAAMCAFLCSAQAGYVTGQNIQLDGGAYAGLI